MNRVIAWILLAGTILTAGTPSVRADQDPSAAPMGPTVMVTPSPNKPFDVFLRENTTCRRFAQTAVENTPPPQPPATSLAERLATRDAPPVSARQASAGAIQQTYDEAYAQCMYAHGNQVPGWVPPGLKPSG